jgi:hypothetical protein
MENLSHENIRFYLDLVGAKHIARILKEFAKS